MRIRNYALLISFLVLSSRLFSQTLANYTSTRTTGITYNSISSTGSAIDSWRYAAGGFSQDDNRSNPMDIGFDFWYNGTRYTQFNVSVNGYVDFSTSTADGGPDGGDYSYDNNAFTTNGSGTWLALAPFYDDMTAQGGTDALGNSIKYQVTGTAPNRVLTIEWIDMAVYLNTSPSLNFQVKLYETTGEIDFVYGTMTQGTNTFSYTCGINAATLNNTPTAAQLKTQQTANSNTFNNTQQNALVTIPASNSQITFIPPVTTPAPSGSVTFTGVTQTGMTVNWPNWCSNEVGYVLYNSTDNVTYNYVTQTAANATSYASTGLLPGTLYYWKVYAVTEGDLSTALSGSQTTTAAGTVISITTGNWNATTTWNCGCIPSASDNVTIANTHTVTLNANGVCNTLTVGQGASGILHIGNNGTARTLAANSNITVNAGATLDVATGSNTTHTLTLGGNLTNNGTLNFAPDANSFCDVTFTKNGNQTISGSATTNNFHFLTLSMGTSISNTLDVTSTNFTATNNFLTLNTGVFKLSTTGTVAVTPFTTQNTIPNKAGITVNSANATVTFGAGIDLFGNLIVNSGAVNIGNANDENVASDGGVFQIFGGTVKIAGCYYSTDINTLAKFTISGGTLTLPTSGSTSTTIAPFQIDGVGSTFNMSGGTVIIERKGGGGSNLGYTVTGVTNSAVTGGTLQIGDASTPATQTININSSCRVGNLLVNSANATGMLTTNSLLVAQNITIASGTLNANNLNFTLGGNWTNNSTFTPGTGTVIFSNSTGQTIGGSVVTAFRGLTIDDASGVTLALNTSVAGALTFVAGVINTGTNKVTMTTTGTVTGAGSTKFVNGFLEKNVATGTNVTRNYEVGYGSVDYLPVSLTFASVTTAGNVTAKANDGDHPNIATSCIDPTQSVNRYWQFTNTGTVFTNYSATCNFIGVGSDADAGSVPANYYMSVYNGTTWTMLTQGTTSATSNQGTGATVLGALQVGQKISPVITVQPLPTTVCNNTIATFSVTATGAVSYQWQQNTGSGFTNLANAGIYSGVTTATLTINPATTAMNTYQYRCILNASCGGSTTSSAVVLTVTPNVAASVLITASPATTICAGSSVTFTATPTNGGTTPVYQWKVNGVNVGTNSPTYTTTTLANGNLVTCVMTSNAACVTGSPATSNVLTIVVNPAAPVSVSIAASATTICAGTSVTFTATPTNGGTTPAYQWKVNGTNAGTNATTFTSATLNNGDVVTCVLTSNATCATGSPATSNAITMTVNPNLPVSVSIAASPGTTICAGTSVTFTATPTNGGTTPAYQWKVNGVNAGTNSPTFTTTTLTNGNTVTCVLTSNATCATGNPATSNTLTMTVNPNLPVSVSIAASATTICAGTSVTFTATPTNGGTTPAYQWKVNGVNVGTNATTFTSTTLNNGDVVTCVLTSNATCATGNPAASNTVTMTVNPNLPVSVSIAASPGTTICAGTSVTFTATPTNGGTTPAYQWKVNGVNAGTNSPTFTTTTLTNGNTITCVLTSNATCATGNPATSNTITMTVNANLPVSVSIAASATTICAGTSVTFTATPTNGGTTPAYQWKVNGTNSGTNSSTFTSTTLNNSDVVTCVLTSNATCATGNPATSNSITMTVNPNLPVSVSIAASPSSTICAGSSVTFTATPTNGGTTPAYQWKVNGVNAGTNSTTFTTSTLTNGNTVTCVLTSNATCATGNPATSNTITMTVNPNLPASVSIAASSTTICPGTNVTFTATPTNGGTTPAYQWKLNGGNVGTNSATYSNTGLVNGDVVTCVMTSNASPCLTGSPATSNSITITVNAALPVSVSIAASPSTTICAGTSVTFTATPVNGGGSPSYQWKVNGVNAGTNSPTFTTTTLTNGNTVTCVLTSTATCGTGSPATSNTLTMTVNPNLPVSVSIAASATTICAGTSVTFTATPTNGGTTPAYQWKVNGTNSGTNSATFTSTTLNNGDVVTCVLTSNATCATGSPATSNTITMTVNPNLPVSVSIAASATTICAGTSVTFTATPTNGGTTPAYQWKVNGTNSGTNSTTFTSTTLNNGDVVTCVLTSNATCATGNPATSNSITITVNPNLPVSVSIAASATTICAGTSVTFTATPTNGGTTPAYQWKVNGVNAGTNSTTFTTTTLANGNTVTCTLTSNATCATGSPVTSNTITMTVNPNLPVSVSIAASATTICAGTSVTFTATPTNGGTSPAYQWKVNGVNTGTNAATFTSTTLNNGDVVTCVLTSNATCATGNPATSNTITMTVNPNLPVSVSISASATTICAGTSVAFTATPTNGGTTPSYQWKVNGINSGTNSTTFTSTTLNNGDVVTCVLTSNATCATGNPATSNTITMTVNPNLPVSVSIAASATTICAGTSVTFTATPTNGGTTPAYQWKVNGTNTGTNAATFTTTTLNNGDVVTCVLTSNATCATGNPATSNSITITVNPNLPVSVSIVASPTGTICFGTNVTFTATPTNGGTTPVYQWKVNGVNVGSNSTTYSSTTLNNADVVTCVLTSNATCATGNPATSNSINMSVNPSLPVSAVIAASPSATICAGSSVTFTVTPTNGGTTPTYQWQVNGVNAGTNSTTFTSTTFNNGDAVTCIVTSNATCATGSPATSNTVTMTVNPNLPVSVSIAASPAGSVCLGTTVTYTATPINGGTTPSYQWKVNGTNAGTNSATYSSSTFANGDVVTCVLTSNATCATGSPATSNNVTQTITTPGNWIGVVSTDWSNASNWCGGVPTNTTNVVIPSGTPFAPVLTAAADCKNIDIATGVVVDLNNNALNVYGAFSGSGFIKGSLTSGLNIGAGTGSAGTFNMDQSTPGLSNNLNSITLDRSGNTATVGNTLTVTGTIGIAAGTLSTGNNLTLVSTASATARVAQLNAGADLTGNVTMQRFIPAGTDGWIFLGSAVSGATLQQWDDDFITGGFPGSQYPTSVINPSITGYDETLSGVYDDGYTTPTITDPINTGTGFWAYIMGTPLIVDVTGPIQKNLITFPVTYTDDPAQPASEDGWNLLANPYPSTIDWDGPGWTKTHINNAVYMYSPTLDQYTSYVGGIGTNGGSNLIASSQAFLVQANAAGPVLKLQETGKSAADGLFIRASTSASADDLIKLDLTGTGGKDETVIHFNSGATAAFDLPYDAMKFFSLTSTVPGIASMLDTNNMSVNTYPLLTSDMAIPVKVKVGTSGTYTIHVDSITRFPEGACVIMHDLLNGTQTDLRNTSTYSFYISDTTVYPRFVINIGAPVHVASTPSSCNGNANGMAVALGHGSGPLTYTWQNATGTIIQTHTVTGADTLNHIAAGTYTVLINGNTGPCAVMAGTVIVSGADSIDVQADIINAGCAGDPDGAINVTSVNGGNAPYTYNWSNGVSGIANANITAGTYSLSVTDSAGCIQEQTYVVPQNSALTAGFVMSTDTVLLNANAPVIYNNTSTGGTTFTWNFGDGSADNHAASPEYLYKLPGTYTVTLVVSDGTCTDTVTQTIIVLPYYSDPGTTTGISESAKANEQIRTATNGDQSDIIFDFDKNTDVVIEVYNSIGQQVFTKINATVHKGKIALDFEDKAKGIYYIKITSVTGINVVKKIVRS